MGVHVVVEKVFLTPNHHHQPQEELAHHGVAGHQNGDAPRVQVVKDLAPLDLLILAGIIGGLEGVANGPAAGDGVACSEVTGVVGSAAALATWRRARTVRGHERVGAAFWRLGGVCVLSSFGEPALEDLQGPWVGGESDGGEQAGGGAWCRAEGGVAWFIEDIKTCGTCCAY